MTCSRRVLLQTAIGCAAATSSAHALTFGQPDWPKPGDSLSPVEHPSLTLRLEHVVAGAPPLLVYPRKPDGSLRTSLFSQLLVLRLDTGSESPDPHSLLAYTAICSHAGCVVSSWIED